jgi:hypothetical protein
MMVVVAEGGLPPLTRSPLSPEPSWTTNLRDCLTTCCAISLEAKIKADKLRNLAKIMVPDERKTVDRMREAIKAYAQARDCEVPVLATAQAKCEQTLDWITQVERRCELEQIYLDQKQPAREVNFVPFASGTLVSIFEFFHSSRSLKPGPAASCPWTPWPTYCTTNTWTNPSPRVQRS